MADDHGEERLFEVDPVVVERMDAQSSDLGHLIRMIPDSRSG